MAKQCRIETIPTDIVLRTPANTTEIVLGISRGEVTIVADCAERIVHPDARSVVSPFKNGMAALWYEPMATYGVKYKQSLKRLIS